MSLPLYSDISVPGVFALAAAATWLVPRLWRRLQLSRAKHRSLAGHSRMAKRIARWIPPLQYNAERFYAVDGAPTAIAAQREHALLALATQFRQRFSRGLGLTATVTDSIADVGFTARYRVPAPFSHHLRKHLRMPAFIASANDVRFTDLDGNELYDLTGSYGVNVFGNDFYKDCIREAMTRAETTGPVLGSYHPAVADVAARLRKISGLPAVSFHMSGTEAVMQAVRLARYHTRRPYLVRFCGAYHGWWEDVQPGIGNPLPPRETYTLSDMDERSLEVLRHRDDIACVLINPLQALHPNAGAPGDSTLMSQRTLHPASRADYATWLSKLRDVCSERGIVLIFDEVFVGFRLAKGGAQEYYNVNADLVTYGKTLGGGLPIGAVCGRADLMRRYRPEAPADICFARGTFNSHPYVMAAAQVFLERIETPAILALYENASGVWERRLAAFNAAMQAADLPLRATGLQSIWTIVFTRPARYHWMLQYYLRAEGIALSWVGSGRLIFSLNYTEEEFSQVLHRFVTAGRKMLDAGWWWQPSAAQLKLAQRQLLTDMLRARLGNWQRDKREHARSLQPSVLD
jgi:glutamate-1-semialdehyde 2,1-aminomutase